MIQLLRPMPFNRNNNSKYYNTKKNLADYRIRRKDKKLLTRDIKEVYEKYYKRKR
jgi:hypothetical protein